MAEPASRPHKPESDPKWLREDLGKEYYEVLGVVSNYDGWLLIVKGWSVTLSLAALGLGFQQRHYAFFGIAAVTGAAFWYLDALMKGYQYRYYVRMREIEYTAWLINRVPLGGEYEEEKAISAPNLRHRWRWPNVMLPHVVAVVIGLLLLIIFTSLNVAGVDHLRL